VADVVAHVLGDVMGRIGRGAGAGRVAPAPGEPLGVFLDRINDEWVVAWRRASPALLVDLLRWAGPAHDDGWWRGALDDPSLGVSWAGVDPAPLWFDAARDLTEYWVHEQQVRSAVGRQDPDPEMLAVVLDVFARGLPYTLGRSESLGIDRFRLVAEPAGSWVLGHRDGRWSVDDGDAATTVGFDADDLWRRWTRQPDAAPVPPDASPLERAVLGHVAIVHSDPG
jgi:uncharacterized protein (TIGR03083 family)